MIQAQEQIGSFVERFREYHLELRKMISKTVTKGLESEFFPAC